MAKEQLNQKEQHYADTREEAEQIVEKAKESKYLTMHKITGKTNKFGPYFLIDLTYTYNTPKEIMEESDGNDTPEGQLSIDDVEKEEEIDPDSIQFETPEEVEGKSIEELEEKLPF